MQRQSESDKDQGPVVKAKRAPSGSSLDEWDGYLAAGHAEYRGWCPFCVAGKEKSDGWRHHETMGIQVEYAFMGRAVEDRASPILVGRFSKDRWLITQLVPCKGTLHWWIVGKLVNEVIMSGVQSLVVKSDQEVSIVEAVLKG